MVKIFEHFWIKIIALLLGLLLWFHVATEKIYTSQLHLPVSDVILDDGLTLSSNPPDSLMVTVSATGKQLMRKKWRDRGLKIIANQLKVGEHNLPLNTSNTFMSTPTSDVVLEEILSPSNIDVSIDRIYEIIVKVSPDIDAEADDGFAVSSVQSVVPDEVKLIGPMSIVRRIPVVFTEKKVIKKLRDNISLTLPLAKPSGFGVELKPDSVSLSIEVVPVKTRVFENLPIMIYNTPSDRTVTATPNTVRVEVTGPPTEIDILNRNALAAVTDYRDMNAIGKVPVKIDCPAKFQVKNIAPDTVTLYIQ